MLMGTKGFGAPSVDAPVLRKQISAVFSNAEVIQ